MHRSTVLTGNAARVRHIAVVTVTALALALGAAACDDTDGSSATRTSAGTSSSATVGPGGTLTALSLGPVTTWDPQRMGSRADITFAKRVFLRTLTSFAASPEVEEQGELLGDLAEDTGRASDDLKTWTFTLREGLKWDDGSELTCADVAYGISRGFAVDSITGGPGYAIAHLDIPTRPDGTSTYPGPYSSGQSAERAQADFDKAVSCSERTLTVRLANPMSDFNELVSQPAFAPYPKDRDQQGGATYVVHSSGPYLLEKGEWKATEGGTFVRNPHWDPKTDPVRKAYPDRIVYEEGVDSQEAVQRIMTDGPTGRTHVALDSAPPALQQQITAAEGLRNRSINPGSHIVDYLAPNLRSEAFENPDVRRALALSTNRDAYVTALGGETAATPATSLLSPVLPASHDTDPVGAPVTGDVEAAREALAESGVPLPVPMRIAYRSSPTMDKAMAALVPEWRDAGFDPQLQPIADDYFSVISDATRASETDVFWANWAPEWPSGSTVLGALFDSRINVTDRGAGRDYGYVVDEELNARMTEIASIADAEEREEAWSEVDISLLEQVDYIALAQRRSLYIAGSGVTNLMGTEVLGGFVDFAEIAVAR